MKRFPFSYFASTAFPALMAGLVIVGMALQFPDLPSLKSESAIRQAVGFLKTAKHVIKDGRDQAAPLIESDENRELFRSLVQEIKEIISEDVTETTTG